MDIGVIHNQQSLIDEARQNVLDEVSIKDADVEKQNLEAASIVSEHNQQLQEGLDVPAMIFGEIGVKGLAKKAISDEAKDAVKRGVGKVFGEDVASDFSKDGLRGVVKGTFKRALRGKQSASAADDTTSEPTTSSSTGADASGSGDIEMKVFEPETFQEGESLVPEGAGSGAEQVVSKVEPKTVGASEDLPTTSFSQVAPPEEEPSFRPGSNPETETVDIDPTEAQSSLGQAPTTTSATADASTTATADASTTVTADATTTASTAVDATTAVTDTAAAGLGTAEAVADTAAVAEGGLNPIADVAAIGLAVGSILGGLFGGEKPPKPKPLPVAPTSQPLQMTYQFGAY